MRSASKATQASAVSDTLTSDEMETRAETLLTDFLDEFTAARTNPANRQRWWKLTLPDTEAGTRIMAEERRLQAILVRHAALAYTESFAANVALQWGASGWRQLTSDQHVQVQRNAWRISAATKIISALCRRTLPLTADDILAIADAVSTLDARYSLHIPALSLLRVMRPALEDDGVMARCRPALERCRAAANNLPPSADQRALTRTLDELLLTDEQAAVVVIYPDEWGDQVNPLLAALAPELRGHWLALLAHCATARSSTPSEKWLRAGREIRAMLGAERFAAGASDLLAAFRTSANKPPAYVEHSFKLLNNGSILDERNADLLRGLIWLCADMEDARLVAALGDGVLAGYHKLTGHGPRSAKVGGACVYALQHAPNLSGAAQLERARLNVKQPQYLKGIERALEAAASAAGLAREDLEELTVPSFDLVDGRRSVVIGSAAAELDVTGTDVTLRWRDADGKPRKAEPAEVKREHKAEVKDLKRLRDDLAGMLAAQCARLERLLLSERRWPLAVWRERYLDHPLVGLLARRLIWRFEFAGRCGGWRVAGGRAGRRATISR